MYGSPLSRPNRAVDSVIRGSEKKRDAISSISRMCASPHRGRIAEARGLEHATNLAERARDVRYVVEHVVRNHGVERRVLKRYRLGVGLRDS